MKYIMVGVGLLILSIQSFAEQSLSKPLLEQYVSTIEKFQVLEDKYPAMESEFENVLQMTPSAAIDKIKGMQAYSDIEKIVKAAGYDNFEQFYQQSYRIMSSMFAVQMQQMPDSVESMGAMLNSTIERMKKSGMPSEMISKMEKEMAEQKANIDSMATLAKSASDEDIAFMKENMMWLMSIMPTGIANNQ
ncbi:hypothetical protein [Thalassotalea castellviae]|uniref:DUF2059 domain-containing protein n=1 Tax=Thalassotalea castellviae TaxID=3075612 RepID=A0ABU3A4U3_9GAMM|nr:hypothetical protein [Thalassotalea sp. W431]MDT0604547.1 hypothetical protein [Thalassotalea sp. W431]